MAAGTDADDLTICQRCSFSNHVGDQFCERCGTPIGPPPARRDATTRYLCAAAHLDPVYGDAAIAEFLVEPVRAIPPAPGIDSAAVLRDAVAARARRRIRDAALLLLLLILAFADLSALVIWLIIAVITSAALSVGRTSGPSDASTLLAAVLDGGIARGRRRAVTLLLVAGIVVLGIAVLPQVLNTMGYRSSDTTGLLPEFLLGVVTLAVIGADKFIVHNLVYTRFGPGQFMPDARRAHSNWERTVRTLGHVSFQTPLDRVAAADERETRSRDQADVVVHRGFSPFIGAGEPMRRQLIALPLEPSEEDEDEKNGADARSQPREISVVKLQQHVADAIDELRSSSSLGPNRRFKDLDQREQVLMAADRLVIHLDTQPLPAVLPDIYQAPAAHMPVAAARHLADIPQEWARYYRCFRIEAWDRDLTTSCYLHAGTDQRMLFLEWTFCVLLPIRESYRDIDRFRSSPILTPLGSSLLELVVLPATVIRRVQSVFRRFVPLVQREGEVVPDRYGAGRSLRELAADDDVQSYFQLVDVARYVKVIDAVLVRAVGDYLEEHGYSVVEFQRLAQAPLVDARGATFNGSALGPGATVQGSTFGDGPAKEKR